MEIHLINIKDGGLLLCYKASTHYPCLRAVNMGVILDARPAKRK